MTTDNAQIAEAHKAGKDARQRGASLVEYSILVALIAIVSIAAVTQLGTTISSQFTKLATSVETMTP